MAFEEKIEEVKEAISIKLPKDPKKEIVDITNELKMLIDAEDSYKSSISNLALTEKWRKDHLKLIENSENRKNSMIKAVGEYLREALEGTQLEHCETLLKEKDYYELKRQAMIFEKTNKVKGFKLFGIKSDKVEMKLGILRATQVTTDNIINMTLEISGYKEDIRDYDIKISVGKASVESHKMSATTRAEKINKLMNRLKTLQPTSKMDEKIQDHFGFENNSGGFRMG
jgi:hypothetical protein